MTAYAELEETVDVAAPPATVWSLVTDLRAMSRWSPQVARTIIRGGDEVRLGTRALNINRDGLLVWPTRSKVIRFDPEREFAFRVKDNRAIWSFLLEPTATGTRVTQRRELPQGISEPSRRLTNWFMGGQESFASALRDGMQETLRRIKAEAEATN